MAFSDSSIQHLEMQKIWKSILKQSALRHNNNNKNSGRILGGRRKGRGTYFPNVECDCQKAEFLNLGAADIWGWITLCCGAVLCTATCLLACLASAH